VLLLVLTTVVWGTTFPLVKIARGSLEPAELIALRFVMAGLVLLPFLRGMTPRMWRDGALLGVALFASFATQTIGLGSVSSGRAAFITGLNVVIVPLCLPFLRQRVPVAAFVGAFVAVTGIGLMSWDDGALRFSVGDLWVLGCAVSYAAYVLMLERFTPHHASMPLAAVQVFTVAVLGVAWIVPGLASEGWGLVGRWLGLPLSVWWSLAYLGVVAVALTTITQTVAQRQVPAFQAAVIYALEPVFAAVFSYWWLAETLNWRGYAGAAMIMLAMLLSQWPPAAAGDQGRR
jgi:drug/metabolite transporter (DMT)-like permease